MSARLVTKRGQGEPTHVTFGGDCKDHAHHLTGRRKVPPAAKATMQRMATGTPVLIADAEDAIFLHLVAGVTTGSAHHRNGNRDAALELWKCVRDAQGVPSAKPDDSPALYEAPDLSTIEAVEEFLTT